MEIDETTAYIGIGSNLGDREKNLHKAIDNLSCIKGIEVFRASQFYLTAPIGYIDQPDFLNGVVEIKTTLDPHTLLKVCHQVEDELKRVHTIKWGPRTIDLDILLYGNVVMNEKYLVIPHPGMNERVFVLKPLSELVPNVIHPITNITIHEMLSKISIIEQKFL
jgi:2-amino-4-hydroxy-6-hydroxymethyldihydropteridine diphosphokinase